MTRTTLLEKDIDTLLELLVLAMQAKNLINPHLWQLVAKILVGRNETKGPPMTRPKSEYGPPGRL